MCSQKHLRCPPVVMRTNSMKRIFFRTALALAMMAVSAFSSFGKTPVEKTLSRLMNPKSRYVLVAAHRGDWRQWPENSLPAIESAIRMGADIVEIDIWMTKDSVLVLCHDRKVDRTTTGKGEISSLTLSEIRSLRLKTGHDIATDLVMPTLREALLLCKDRIIVNIDKGFDYYDKVLELGRELGMTRQILLKGGRPACEVDSLFAAHSENTLYLPVVGVGSEKGRAILDGYLSSKRRIAYEICWGKDDQAVAEEACRKVIASGSKVYVNSLWPSLNGGYCDDAATKDPDRIYGKLLDMGATIIQSDRPEDLIRYLHSKRRHSRVGK